MGLCKDGAYDWIELYFRDCVYRCGNLDVIEPLAKSAPPLRTDTFLMRSISRVLH